MFIRRDLFNDIKKHLEKEEITILIGARQVGKTTLLKQLQRELENKKIPTIYLNLDIEQDFELLSSQNKLLQKLRFHFGEQRSYVFIDEIQRKENAGLFLKGLYDMGLPYKFIVSGSGSLEIKAKLKESLAGRKKQFVLHPISFRELVDYRTEYKFSDRLKEFLKVENRRSYDLLVEYLNFGGYPKIILSSDLKEKYDYFDEITQAYFERDLNYLLNFDSPQVYTLMLKVLASHLGKVLNYNQLARILNLNIYKVKKLLWFAEQTFIMHLQTPFYRNRLKELRRSPVVYFEDIGLAAYANRTMGKMFEPEDLAFAFQNFVFQKLKDYCDKNHFVLHYWRTSDGAEVDFVINTGLKVVPVEVKFKHLKKPVYGKSLLSFIKTYKPENAYIINLNMVKSMKFEHTCIHFVPWYEIVCNLKGLLQL